MGVGMGLPDTSPGDPMPPESPKAEILSWLPSEELQSLSHKCRALAWKETIQLPKNCRGRLSA